MPDLLRRSLRHQVGSLGELSRSGFRVPYSLRLPPILRQSLHTRFDDDEETEPEEFRLSVAFDPAMPELTAEQIQRAIEACCAHLTELSETFRGKLDCEIQLSASEARPFSGEVLASEFGGSGLSVTLAIENQGLLFLIPEAVPLPAWYREPGIAENNRLQTFAHELSLQILPADLQADRYAASATANLSEFANLAQINPNALMLELSVHLSDATDQQPPVSKILVICPVDAPQLPATELAENISDTVGDEVPPSDPDPTTAEEFQNAAEPADPQATLDGILRALRVLRVPVTVSVRLAERKMPVGQVVAMAPGSLITFSKSCEDLLDLFVNNRCYCQGEAIKIGENFGLKVTRLGAPEERKEHPLELR